MSKELFLYSEDKKYKCAVELADSLDKFNCPDHSVMILFEERENGTYIIAQARDKRLETEKDAIIDDLKMHNADFVRELTDANNKIADLETKLAESNENVKLLAETRVAMCNTIKDLEAKLAEMTEKYNACQEARKLEAEFSKQDKKELREQLAEKDKQIETQKSNIEFLYDLFVSPQGEQTLKAITQDKIEFALEQIIKLKNELADRVELIECGAVAEFMFTTYDLEMCSKQIIKQIKEIDNGKDV